MGQKLYVDLWKKHRESIKEALKKAVDKPSIQLNSKEFNMLEIEKSIGLISNL